MVLILAVQISSGPLQHIVLALSSLLFSVLISCHALKTSFANFSDVALQTCRMHMEVVDLLGRGNVLAGVLLSIVETLLSMEGGIVSDSCL